MSGWDQWTSTACILVLFVPWTWAQKLWWGNCVLLWQTSTSRHSWPKTVVNLLMPGKTCLAVLNTLLWWTPKLAQRSLLTGKTVLKAHTQPLRSGRSYLTVTNPGFSQPMALYWPMRKKVSYPGCWNAGIQNAKKCRPRKKPQLTPRT